MSLSSTTDYPLTLEETTTTAAGGAELYAEFISAPASSMSPAAIAEHMQQNQITFEIPTAHDLRHIDALHSFNALLQRIGNAAVNYDSSPHLASSASISTEQLSNSVVLDLADLRDNNEGENNSTWEQIFGEADMHAIVNYLWIGVVTSLVVLSLIFIVFSCYFYRKFRTWKKCSKYSNFPRPKFFLYFLSLIKMFVGCFSTLSTAIYPAVLAARLNNIKCRILQSLSFPPSFPVDSPRLMLPYSRQSHKFWRASKLLGRCNFRYTTL